LEFAASSASASAARESANGVLAASAPLISLVDFSATCIEQQKRRVAAAGLSRDLDCTRQDVSEVSHIDIKFRYSVHLFAHLLCAF
jgi:hypothetical protein